MTLASRWLCTLVAVTYSTWLVSPLVDPELDPWTSYASEYFVAGRPAAPLLRTTDGVSGVLLVVIAVLSYSRARILWRGLPGVPELSAPDNPDGPDAGSRRRRLAVRTWCGAVACAGLATVVDAINPMTCAPSISSACAKADSAGTLPMQHELHTASSGVAGVSFIVAMLATAVLAARTDRLAFVLSWVGVVTVALSGIDAMVTSLHTEGMTQRVSMVAIVVWLVVAARLPVNGRERATRGRSA